MAANREPPPAEQRIPRMIGALLRIPFQETVRRVHSDLTSAGFDDLRPAHLVVFQHLDQAGTRQTDLAERAQITKQSMGYLVDYLVGHGYVTREPDPSDGRASLVCATERGRTVEREARASLERLESEWRSLLGNEPYRQMKAVLAQLAERVSAHEAH